MAKHDHEIRDPIHVFVRLDSYERKVLDARPLQRLRHIHQLALTSFVYPGATHRRFEHSLGVMELAGRIYDVVTDARHVTDPIRKVLPEIDNQESLSYWRRVVRMAALCHDAGHLPFSHAAEKELLPEGWDHERLTREIIGSEEMVSIWDTMIPPLRSEHVVKLAVGPGKATDLTFSDWETILAEIIVGDAFGADRMDYLLRDAYHAGVVYGKFDHYRLIDTMRILPAPNRQSDEDSLEPELGVEEGGLRSAEALLLARYFMYSQVYFHPVRRIYDIHLKDFLAQWLRGGLFSTTVSEHLSLTDNEVTAALLNAAFDPAAPGHEPARRIIRREHFRVAYSRHPRDAAVDPEAGAAVLDAAAKTFGAANVRRDRYTQKGRAPSFPVLMKDGRFVSSLEMSEVIRQLPLISVDDVFVEPRLREKASAWLAAKRGDIIHVKEKRT